MKIFLSMPWILNFFFKNGCWDTFFRSKSNFTEWSVSNFHSFFCACRMKKSVAHWGTHLNNFLKKVLKSFLIPKEIFKNFYFSFFIPILKLTKRFYRVKSFFEEKVKDGEEILSFFNFLPSITFLLYKFD